MSVQLAVSLTAGVVAVVSAVLTAVLGARAAKGQLQLQAEIEQQQAARRRHEERQDLMSKIRDPVLWAAFDLQSRLFNIVADGFLSAYLAHGTVEERRYAKCNTLFVFGQYLGWVEIVRREVQFLELGSKQESLRLINCFSKISGILSSDAFANSLFRIFRGDQRAIGEVMIDRSVNGDTACIGYAEFSRTIDADPSFAQWFELLASDIEQLGTSVTAAEPRLAELQRNIVDLINILDPDLMRFPERQRNKLLPGHQGFAYSVDLVFVIDATRTMASILERVKLSAIAFPRDLQKTMSNVDKHVDLLRVRVIAFRDFYTDSATDSLVTSDFFTLPDHAENFGSFIRNIRATGGGGDGEFKTALEALAAAIRSPWAKEGSRQRQIIVVWSDAGAHRLEKEAGSKPIGYPEGTPANLDELTDMWEGKAYMSSAAKRLLIYAPDVYPWTDIVNDWESVAHVTSNAALRS